MGLDVGLIIKGEFKIFFTFKDEDEGYYCFLHPLFEKLQTRTRIYIDLYGNAKFHQGNIHEIESVVKEAQGMIENMPMTWQVHCGQQTYPEVKDLYYPVTKKEFNRKIDILLMLIKDVKLNGSELFFNGD